MKKILISFLIIIFSIPAFAQNFEFEPANFTVYNSDKSTLFKLTKTFIDSNQKLFILPSDSHINDLTITDTSIIVLSQYFMEMPKTFCWGSMYITTELNFRIKNEKIRIEFKNIRFEILPPGGKSECIAKGSINELINLNCCKTVKPIENYLIGKYSELRNTFKKYIINNKNQFAW